MYATSPVSFDWQYKWHLLLATRHQIRLLGYWIEDATGKIKNIMSFLDNFLHTLVKHTDPLEPIYVYVSKSMH